MRVDSQQLEEIFGQALAYADVASRRAYLDRACDGAPDVRARIDALLAAHESGGSLLDLPEAQRLTAPLVHLSERPGATIGRFKLLEQIGEGGFGVVFMAEQQSPVRRLVALKVIKLGMDTAQVVARFEAERQALAMMDHAHVAKVLDGGATPAGRPYFVMELVKGAPITEFCAQRQLSIAHRLELFAQVCSAIQHAHLKGLIHRDVKPSNVLVSTQDDRPAAKVIDFGVAKAMQTRLTEKTLFTEFHQLVGTPEYMSPEQAAGGLDVDTRSDVYSLGVLLYEILAGSPPFDPKELRLKTFVELQRTIREVEPPAPSTRLSSLTAEARTMLAGERRCDANRLCQILKGDLDWIVMRCLEKDRTRRYQTANDLAQDLQRYLNDEAVEARRPTRSYRLKKFVRRNKAGIAVVSSIAALLLTAIVILLTSNARIRREVKARDLALDAKDVALKEKDAALAMAREAVDRMLTQVASERFSDMPLSHPLRIALLEDAMAFYQRLGGQMHADPSLSLEMARLLHTHAGLLREVGSYDRATQALRQSRDLLQELSRTDPDPPAILEERNRVELDLAFTLHRGDESKLLTNDEAQAQYRRAFKLSDNLQRQWPGRCEPPVLSLRMLAKVALARGERSEALRLWNAAIDQGEAYARRHPDNVDIRIEVAWACVHRCDSLGGDSLASLTESEDVLARGLKVVGEVLNADPKSTRADDATASLQIRLGTIKCRQGHDVDAEPLFEQAVARMEALCEGCPWEANYWNSLRWFHQEIASQLRQAGRPESAQHALRQFGRWLERVSPQMAEDAEQREQVRQSQKFVAELLGSTGQGGEVKTPIQEQSADARP